MKNVSTVVRIGFSLFVFAMLIAGCAVSEPPPSLPNSIQTYRDIPGITPREIAAIEALKSQRQSFSFGVLHSAYTYVSSDSAYTGFSPLLCELLSNLFGIPFVLQKHDWRELKDGVDSCSVDFAASINAPAGVDNRYFKTSPISGNKLTVFVHEGARDVVSEYDLRGLRVGFFSGCLSENITRNVFPRVDFESVEIHTVEEVARKLESGEIDAFIFDAPDVFSFYEYGSITRAAAFPYVYVPVSISTANPDLEPVISAITKYLMAGGIDNITKLLKRGEREYASQLFRQLLNDDERAYIDDLAANGGKVPVGFTNNRYPVAFYDNKSKEYQGIAKDVLDEISLLTGIEFHIGHDTTAIWAQLEGMLKTGEIKLISQLISNDARREYAIWPDSHYFSARYALLSNLAFPYLSQEQIPYATIGLVAGTAEEPIFRRWFPDTEYKTFRTSDDVLAALEKGEIDLYFSLDYTLLYETNFRENAGQKINVLFNEPVEKVTFGLHKDEVMLCSIISKAQKIINTERIVRNWTSHVFDMSSYIAKVRVRILTIAVGCLLAILTVMFLLIVMSFRLRKKLKDQMRVIAESGQNLQTLLDMLPVGVRILSLDDWTLLYSNKACLKVFGCSSFEEQVKGQSGFGFMPEFQPDGRKTDVVVNEFFKSGESVIEMQCLKLDGRPFTCHSISCKINYEGRPASLAVMQDVTAERRYQQMLKNAALKEQEANQLKSRFLATVSHEIRTPLNAILGITEIQLQNESLPADTKEALGRIYESGDMLLNIINDILDFSKVEAGKLEIVPVQYDISSLINDALQINRLYYKNKPIEFFLDIDENTPLNLYGDELRIKQILNNVLSNAFKYTETGTVILSVSAEPNGENDDVNMIFQVSDTGQGMTAEQINMLFVEYTRFNTDANKITPGTGLGMSITKRLVDLMGGRIFVESAPQTGSVFTVRLPQKRSGTAVCGSDLADKLQNFNFNSTAMTKKTQMLREYMPYGKAMVVDDIESNIYVTRGMLLPYGLKVETASSGFDVIEKIKGGNEYDIVFMDHMMPKMDGIEATKIIRDMGYKKPIIALTANAIVGQAGMFLENGFDGYITKPIDSRELNAVLNEFIRNRQPSEAVPAAEGSRSDAAETAKRSEMNNLPSKSAVKQSELEEAFMGDAENAANVLDGLYEKIHTFNDEDMEVYETTVHGMKSALTYIDEKELSAAALRLEQAAKQKDLSVMSDETPAFVDKLRSVIKKFKPENESVSPPPRQKADADIDGEDAAYLREKLRGIQKACAALNANDAKKALDDLSQKTWPPRIYEVLDDINVHLLHGAFQKAAAAAEAAEKD